MRVISARTGLCAAVLLMGSLVGVRLLAGRGGISKALPPIVDRAAAITVDSPAQNTIFPPDFAPPAFEWRDADSAAATWRIDVVFQDGSSPLHITSQGERMQIGELDERCAKAGALTPQLTPEEARRPLLDARRGHLGNRSKASVTNPRR